MKISKQIIKFRKSFIEMYSKLNSFNTKLGVLHFGDKLDITLNDGKVISGYLSKINEKLEIINKESVIEYVDVDNIFNLVNNQLSQLLNEPIRKAKVHEIRTSFNVNSRRIETSWIKFYSI